MDLKQISSTNLLPRTLYYRVLYSDPWSNYRAIKIYLKNIVTNFSNWLKTKSSVANPNPCKYLVLLLSKLHAIDQK